MPLSELHNNMYHTIFPLLILALLSVISPIHGQNSIQSTEPTHVGQPASSCGDNLTVNVHDSDGKFFII